MASGTSASSWWSDAAVEGNIWDFASRRLDASETVTESLQWSRGAAQTQHPVANDLAEQPRPALCKFYASGGCTRGDSCPFRHDLTVSATTDTDASRGFVLTGQVVNLNTSASRPDVAVSSNPLSKRHVMNPEAMPFVSVDTNELPPSMEGTPQHAGVMHQAAAQENYGAVYGVSPGTYRKNARHQPPLTVSATHNTTYKHSYGYDDAVGGTYQDDEYYSGDHDMYQGVDYPSYQPQWSHEGEGFAGEHYHQRGPQEPKWTPAGVFSTTSDNAAVRQAMAGYYESHQTVGPSSDAWYQHRRMQAMRSPLSSKGHRATSNAYGATTSSNSSTVGGDEDYDADVAGYTYASGYSHNTSGGAYPHNNYAAANVGHRAQQPVQQFHPYPQRESTSRTSAEMHRKLRNRVEA